MGNGETHRRIERGTTARVVSLEDRARVVTHNGTEDMMRGEKNS